MALERPLIVCVLCALCLTVAACGDSDSGSPSSADSGLIADSANQDSYKADSIVLDTSTEVSSTDSADGGAVDLDGGTGLPDGEVGYVDAF